MEGKKCTRGIKKKNPHQIYGERDGGKTLLASSNTAHLNERLAILKKGLQMPVQKGRLWILRRPFSMVKNNRWSDSSDNVHHSDMLLWSLANYGLDLSRQSQLIKKHSVHVANWVGWCVWGGGTFIEQYHHSIFIKTLLWIWSRVANLNIDLLFRTQYLSVKRCMCGSEMKEDWDRDGGREAAEKKEWKEGGTERGKQKERKFRWRALHAKLSMGEGEYIWSASKTC